MITLYDMGHQCHHIFISFHSPTCVCDARGLSLTAGLEQGSILPKAAHRSCEVFG